MTEVLPDITVVVCTHNRLHLLQGCIDSLLRQDADPRSFEVLVIDNGSTDGTGDYLARCTHGEIRFRRFFEPVLGLSHARNLGWREAKGTYVAYLDDDAVAHTDWVREILSFIRRRPEVVMFGGPYKAFMTDPVPDWFPPDYGSMDLGSEERAIDLVREFIVGLNMAFRKDVLIECGGFHPGLGMNGNKVSYGEETQLQFILRGKGYDVFYLPRMMVCHHLPARKMRLAWLLHSAYAAGRCSALTWTTQRTVASHLAGISYGCFNVMRTFLMQRDMPLRRKFYHGLAPLVSEWGALMEFFSYKFNQSGPVK